MTFKPSVILSTAVALSSLLAAAVTAHADFIFSEGSYGVWGTQAAGVPVTEDGSIYDENYVVFGSSESPVPVLSHDNVYASGLGGASAVIAGNSHLLGMTASASNSLDYADPRTQAYGFAELSARESVLLDYSGSSNRPTFLYLLVTYTLNGYLSASGWHPDPNEPWVPESTGASVAFGLLYEGVEEDYFDPLFTSSIHPSDHALFISETVDFVVTAAPTAEGSPFYLATWDVRQEVIAASNGNGSAYANFLHTTTLSSLTFLDGSTPESRGVGLRFASGLPSPNIDNQGPQPVPEPSSLLLLLTGGLIGAVRYGLQRRA